MTNLFLPQPPPLFHKKKMFTTYSKMQWLIERMAVAIEVGNTPLCVFYYFAALSGVWFVVQFLIAWFECGLPNHDCIEEAAGKITRPGRYSYGFFPEQVVWFVLAIGIIVYIAIISVAVGLSFSILFKLVQRCRRPVVTNQLIDEENK